MKSYEERTKDNQYKIDMFRTKQGLPYEAKVKYAANRVREFFSDRICYSLHLTCMYLCRKSTWKSCVIQMAPLEPPERKGLDAVCAGLAYIWRNGRIGLTSFMRVTRRNGISG